MKNRLFASSSLRTAIRVGVHVAVAVVGCLSFCSDAFAYRTAGDLPEFEGTQKVRWKEPLIRYAVYGEPPQGIVLDDALRIMEQSFASWTEPSCSQLVFDQSGIALSRAEPGDNRNTIEWVHVGWSELGFENSAAAVTDVQYAKIDGEWRIVEADLYLNADTVDWAYSGVEEDGKQDFRTVLIHEAGHMLGLMHPCEPEGAPVEEFPSCSDDSKYDVTMHPIYSVERVELAQDDIEGVCFLYPGATCEVEGCPPGYECTEHGCRAVCGDSTCRDGEMCIDGACQAPIEPECLSGDCAPCESDEDCFERFACIEGTCQAGQSIAGDPCAEHSECSDLECSSDGYCSFQCLEDEHCPEGWTCYSELGECVSELAPFGAECSEAAECIGQQCLADLTDDPVCTRLCGLGEPECPLGWACHEVEERQVCIPPPTTNGCGCRTVGQTRSRFPAEVPSIALLLGAILRFRRRRALYVSRQS